MPFSLVLERKVASTILGISKGWKGSASRVVLPASSFEKSRISLMSASSVLALISIMPASSLCSSLSGLSRSISAVLIIAVHGSADLMTHDGEKL